MALHRDLGLDSYPRSPELEKFLATKVPAPTPLAPTRPAASPNDKPTAARPPAGQAAGAPPPSLEDIRQELRDCRRCDLHQGRHHLVFGTGDPRARLMVVGEFPDQADDMAGEPFQGESGDLLARMLKAIGLGREEVYLVNIVKCRPPAGRQPQPDQVNACLPFLHQQITAVGPKVICAMGALAAHALLGRNTPLLTLRGRFHDYRGIPLMPTFPPDFLLKNPEMKRAAWHDLQAIQARLQEG